MCTLIVIHRRVTGAPLVVAANRDEFYARPAEGPALRESASGATVAPRDVLAGGTWLGLSERGVFAAVTNRRCPDPDPARRSRGLAVADALAAGSAAEAAGRLAELPRAAYNPMNLFVADAERAFQLVYEDTPVVEEVAPGVSVVGNTDPNALDVPKVARAMEQAAAAAVLSPDAALDALADVCRSHDGEDGPLSDTCVHTESYGTRSSLLLVLSERPDESRLLYADGPPCENEYLDFTRLLRELSQRARYASGEIPARMAS